MTTDDADAFIEKAAQLACSVDNPSFTIPMALWCTGLTEEKAFVISTQILTKNAIEAIKHEIICKEGIENKKERAKIVFCCAK